MIRVLVELPEEYEDEVIAAALSAAGKEVTALERAGMSVAAALLKQKLSSMDFDQAYVVNEAANELNRRLS